MKKSFAVLFLLAAQMLAFNVFAQPVTETDADKLFNFAEAADPGLFAPPTATQAANVADSDWFLRFYTGSALYLAINVNGTGQFMAGDVYALGGPFGDAPVLVGQLSTLLAYIDSLTADDDNDGVTNTEDQCMDTPSGAPVNAQGCADSQLDDDGDSVNNALDVCPDTSAGALVDGQGCAQSQLDDDLDGVDNALDQCPGSSSTDPVNGQGCSAAQLGIVVLQDDADKLFNYAEQLDSVAFGPSAATQVVSELGVQWYKRAYSNSGISILVSINGVDPNLAGNVYVSGGSFGQDPVFIDTLANLVAFIDSQVPPDDDNDGVSNDSDQCPDTAAGASVNGQGCSLSQLDDDSDGVNNTLDQCPATPSGEPVNGNGCSESQLGAGDDDGDGVNNAADQCPATPTGEAADANGCSASQNTGGEPQYIVKQGSGACAPAVFPPVGLVAKYRTEEDEEDSVLEYTEEWLAVSETEVTTRTSQVLTTQFSTSESVSTTTQYYDFANGLVFLTEMFIEVSDKTTVIGLPIPPEVSEVELSLVFDPFQFLFPQGGYCEGMVLFHPAVTQSTYSNPPLPIDPIVGQTAEFTVNVISVAEQVNVEAGTFNTVHLQEVDLEFEEETTVDVWLDRETGIVVKMESRDSGGNLTVVTELTEVIYP